MSKQFSPVLAACVFAALPLSLAQAQQPVPILPGTPAASTMRVNDRSHTIVLQHVNPFYVLKLLHWQGTESDNAVQSLPNGVARISAMPGKNALIVEATDEGFNQVRQIVRILDRVPRHVQMKVLFASVPAPKARFTVPPFMPGTLGEALAMPIKKAGPYISLSQLTEAGAFFSRSVLLTITNDELVEIRSSDFMRPENSVNSLLEANDLLLWPRINADDTVAVGVGRDPLGSQGPIFASKISVGTRSAFHSGEIMIYDVTDLIAPPTGRLYICITPTILANKTDSGQLMTVTP